MASNSAHDLVRKIDFYRDPKRYNFENANFSLLIVGPSGAGKSAFCNFLLNEKRFIEALGILAGTEKADFCTIPCGGDGDMLIVDCPGFCDPKRPHEEILIEVCKAALLCKEGMDAIGIVIDPTIRFNESQKICFEQMELFGGQFWNHAFIIFSHENEIQEVIGHKNARDYIFAMLRNENCPDQFKTLLAKVENRFICVESSKRKGDDNYRLKILASIQEIVSQVKKSNEDLYSNCFTRKAKMKYFPLNTMWEQLEDLKNHQTIYDMRLDDFFQLVFQYEEEVSKLNEKVNKGNKCTIL